MSQRTDSSPSGERPEFSNEYLFSLVGVTAFVLFLIYYLLPLAGNPIRISGHMPWMFAWILAAGQTIANGLTEFSGKIPELVEKPYLTASLISLFLAGIVAPTLTLLLMRPLSREALPTGSRALYLVGLIIASTYAFTVIPTGLIARSINQRLRDSQAIQMNKDQMINDINMVAMRLREYRILPKRLGGGEGKTDGFVLSSDLASTEGAAYVVRAAGMEATIEAKSKLVDDAGISVPINADGTFGRWTYNGKFQ